MPAGCHLLSRCCAVTVCLSTSQKAKPISDVQHVYLARRHCAHSTLHPLIPRAGDSSVPPDRWTYGVQGLAIAPATGKGHASCVDGSATRQLHMHCKDARFPFPFPFYAANDWAELLWVTHVAAVATCCALELLSLELDGSGTEGDFGKCSLRDGAARHGIVINIETSGPSLS